MKNALSVGINNYPGFENDLTKCVQDMNEWASYLHSIGFASSVMADHNATIEAVCRELELMISSSSQGDHLALTYSGHGSQEPDESGDEADGYDEVICLYDGDLSDDRLRSILAEIPIGVSMTIILDCCFSGTATRFVGDTTGLRKRFRQPKKTVKAGLRRKRSFLSDENMKEVLLSGSSDSQYSYENAAGGLFTESALSILKRAYPLTYVQFEREMVNYLPTSNFPQSPQMEGSTINKNLLMFAENKDVIFPPIEEEPPPEEPPAIEEPESWCNCNRVIKKFYLKLKRKFK